MDHEAVEVLPREEVPERLLRVQAAMGQAGIDVLLAQQNSDLYYLTGFVAQGGDPKNDTSGGPGWRIREEISWDAHDINGVGLASSGCRVNGASVPS